MPSAEYHLRQAEVAARPALAESDSEGQRETGNLKAASDGGLFHHRPSERQFAFGGLFHPDIGMRACQVRSGSSAHFAITATVAHAFLAPLFFVHACPTESRAGIAFAIVPPTAVFTIVPLVTPALDINAHSTRPDVDSLSKLNRMLLRGSRPRRECAAGNNPDAQDDALHGQSFQKVLAAAP
jgi:hypothetical protein